jgi:hypothetical protein
MQKDSPPEFRLTSRCRILYTDLQLCKVCTNVQKKEQKLILASIYTAFHNNVLKYGSAAYMVVEKNV